MLTRSMLTNCTIIQNSLIGLKNIIPIVPLLSPFTSSSVGVNGQFISSPKSSGIYQIKVSTVLTNFYYDIFNSTPSTNNWIGSGYDTSGSYISTVKTTIDSTSIAGDYIQLILPISIILTSYHMHVVRPSPKSWILCGSNDEIHFLNFDQRTN